MGSPDILILWLKASGAALGSSIAVIFRPGCDSHGKLFKRFLIGTILGFISAPVIIDYLGWDHSPDYWLAAATLGGLLGYLTLQIIFSEDATSVVKNKLRAIRGKPTDER